MSNRPDIQGKINYAHGDRQYMRLQNIIFDEAGVSCTVVVKSGECVSIRTKTPADFYLAKSVIRQRTSLPITRDIQELA